MNAPRAELSAEHWNWIRKDSSDENSTNQCRESPYTLVCCQVPTQNTRQLRWAALGSTQTLRSDLRTHRNLPAGLDKENLSAISVVGYGLKKTATSLVWQQSCAARGQADHQNATYIRL